MLVKSKRCRIVGALKQFFSETTMVWFHLSLLVFYYSPVLRMPCKELKAFHLRFKTATSRQGWCQAAAKGSVVLEGSYPVKITSQ